MLVGSSAVNRTELKINLSTTVMRSSSVFVVRFLGYLYPIKCSGCRFIPVLLGYVCLCVLSGRGQSDFNLTGR